MNSGDFKFYQKLLHDESGLWLTEDKDYLVTTRLEPVAKSLGRSFAELTATLRQNGDGKLKDQVVQAMATHETSFFRDMKPFAWLKDGILPELLKRNAATRSIRIWSAACSTGQEPYSIAMIARDFMQRHPGWAVQVTASDFADDALAQAGEGIYSQFDIQRGLSMKLMLEHFTQEGASWRVKDELRRLVRFTKFNLLQPMEGMGRFDVIFCRNVLIYFDTETKKTVLNRLAERLQPEGYLLLGACESVMGLGSALKLSAELPGVHVVAGVPAAKELRR